MSTLFTAVSVEQQETVAGGLLALPNIISNQSASYNLARFVIQSGLAVGPNGVGIVDTFDFTGINTNGNKNESVNFVGLP